MQRTKSAWLALLFTLIMLGSAPAVRADDGARRVGLELGLGSATGTALGVASFFGTIGMFELIGRPRNDSDRMLLGLVTAVPVGIIGYTVGTGAGVHLGAHLMGESGDFRQAWLGALPGMLVGGALSAALAAVILNIGERRQRRNRVLEGTTIAVTIVTTLLATSAMSALFYERSL